MPGPQIRPGNSGGGGSGGGSDSSSGGSSSDDRDRDSGGSSTEDRLSSGGGNVNVGGGGGGPQVERPGGGGDGSTGSDSGGSDSGSSSNSDRGGSVPTDQLGGMPVDAGAEPGDRRPGSGGSSSGDGGGSVPTDQLGGMPVDAPAGTDPRPDGELTDAERERIRDRTPRANQSVSFGTTGTPGAAAGPRSSAARERAEERRQAAEGVAYSDANLYQEEARRDFSESVATSDRRLFEEQAEMENFGDWDWSMGFGGEEDEVEGAVDATTERVAGGFESASETLAGGLRNVEEPLTYESRFGTRVSPFIVDPDTVESAGTVAADVARLPSTAMEAAELGGWLAEDSPIGSGDDEEFARRMGMAADAAGVAGDELAKQARQNPDELAMDAIVGFATGSAAARGARASSLGRANVGERLAGFESRIGVRGELDTPTQRGQLDLGGPRQSGRSGRSGRSRGLGDLPETISGTDPTKARRSVSGAQRVGKQRGGGPSGRYRADDPFPESMGDVPDTDLRNSIDDVAEGAEDVTGFGHSPFSGGSSRPGSGRGVFDIPDSRAGAFTGSMAATDLNIDSGLADETDAGVFSGVGSTGITGQDIGQPPQSGTDTDLGIGSVTDTGIDTGTDTTTTTTTTTKNPPGKTTGGTDIPPFTSQTPPRRPRKPPRRPPLDLEGGSEGGLLESNSETDDDIFSSGIQSAEEAFGSSKK